jgi:hypothetical protein
MLCTVYSGTFTFIKIYLLLMMTIILYILYISIIDVFVSVMRSRSRKELLNYLTVEKKIVILTELIYSILYLCTNLLSSKAKPPTFTFSVSIYLSIQLFIYLFAANKHWRSCLCSRPGRLHGALQILNVLFPPVTRSKISSSVIKRVLQSRSRQYNNQHIVIFLSKKSV